MAARSGSARHTDIPMPTQGEGTLDFDWMGAARKVLTSIMPETEMEVAARYLRKARFAVFLSRAIDAIRKGRLGSHRREFETLFSGRGESFGEALEGAKDGAVVCCVGREALEKKVLRFKVAYALFEANRTLSSGS